MIELRCKYDINKQIQESRKIFVGPIENDAVMQVKIGDKLVITTDESVVGVKGVISVKNCCGFPLTL